MLELETAMFGGQIAAAEAIATRLGAQFTPTAIDQVWAGVALARSRSFERCHLAIVGDQRKDGREARG